MAGGNGQQKHQSSEIAEGASEETGAKNDVAQQRKSPMDNVTLAVTGARNTRVCLGIIPVKVQGRNGGRLIQKYALQDK